MSFYEKLAIFWVGMHVVFLLLLHYPTSRLSCLAFSWYEPVPHPGELKSHFLARWCVYALGWLAQILFLFACGYCFSLWFPDVTATTAFQVLWFFALPILGGMALLGAAIAAGASLKAKYFGPNPRFETTVHEPDA